MTRRTKWIVGGAVALAAVVAVAAAVAANRGPKGTRVRTTTATRGDLVSLVTANGTLEAETKVDLSANIMGQIMQLNVEEGDRVRKGDLLLVIDQTRYGAAVDSRQAGLQVLEAQLTRTREVAQQAARDRERAQRQYEQQHQCDRVGHQHHAQRRHTPRRDPADEIADTVADRRSQRESDPDQVMPLARLPSSRVTSRCASRRAMSWRLSWACLPRASASSTFTLPSEK